MLYVITPPFGNFQDVTLRAAATLRGCHYILAENVSHIRTFLETLAIDVPTIRYHKYNEKEKGEEVMALLKKGRDVALFDTGETELVALCAGEGIPYKHLFSVDPFIAALTLSGHRGSRVQFLRQLPKKSRERIDLLSEALTFPGITFFLEEPSRIVRTVEIIRSLEAKRKMQLFCHLGEEREEVIVGSADTLWEYCEKTPMEKAAVFLIEQVAMTNSYDHLTLQTHVKQLEKELGYSRKEAIKAVAQLRDLPKRTVHHSVQEQDHEY